MGKSEPIVAKLDDDVTEPEVEIENFATLHDHHSAHMENMAPFWTWYIRVLDHAIEQTSILIDDYGEYTPC